MAWDTINRTISERPLNPVSVIRPKYSSGHEACLLQSTMSIVEYGFTPLILTHHLVRGYCDLRFFIYAKVEFTETILH